MYINVERSSRGNLEVSVDVLNKLVENSMNAFLNKSVAKIAVDSEIFQENNLYLILKITLKKPEDITTINEKYVIKEVEDVVYRTLNFKEKNISIVYYQ